MIKEVMCCALPIMINGLCKRLAAPSRTQWSPIQNPAAAPESQANYSRGEGRAGWRTGAMREGVTKQNELSQTITLLCVVYSFLIPHPKGNKEHTTLRHAIFPEHTPSLALVWVFPQISWSHACWLWCWIPRWQLRSKMCLRCGRDKGVWCIWNQFQQWWHQKVWLAF